MTTEEFINAVNGISPELIEEAALLKENISAEKTKNFHEDGISEVTGVDRYHRPVWRNVLAAASVLVLIAGAGTGGALLLKRRSTAPQAAVSQEQTSVPSSEAPSDVSSANTEMIEMPDTSFMQKDLAADILMETGLNVEFCNIEDNSVAPGYVISSSPEPGENVPKGTVVKLYVSIGASSQTVITGDFTGMSIDDAIVIAEYHSFKVSTEEVASSEKAGIVTGQQPQPGEEVEAGSELILYVSKGE